MSFVGGSFGSFPPGEGGGGGGGGPVAYTSSNQKPAWDRRSADLTIPAGALYIHIQNIDIGGTISVNGRVVRAGETVSGEAFVNEVDRKMEYLGEYVIQSNGIQFLFSVSYPGDSPVNPNLL